ncbi:MAG TPA: sugar transferase [Actinomycetales bacterium]|nr:sugar transferase [Actinomycetales bacterium]
MSGEGPLSGGPAEPSGGPDEDDWTFRYAARLRLTDTLVLAYALAGTHIVWFGRHSPLVASSALEFNYVVFSIVLGLVWLAALSLWDTRSPRVVGTGGEEYQRIVVASLRLFGIVAIIAFLAKVEVARGYLAIAFPVGTVGVVASRWMWRQWLHAVRRRGGWSDRVLLVGDGHDVDALARELARQPVSGLRVVGACVPKADGASVPVLGDLSGVLEAAQRGQVQTVAVTSSHSVPAPTLRRIGWALEGTGIDLVVAPALTNIAGPRIHVRPVAGLPLLHVEEPRLPRGGQLAKDGFDRLGSLLLIVLLSPLLLAVAVAVKLSSPGPVFYRQERIGRGGATFSVWKFRSMRQDADAELKVLLAQQDRADQPLFKVENDPRITRVGHVIRRYSLDELPQLLNVLAGDMSLVGPRPQRAEEVAMYDDVAARRLLAKPGMTGLWQVSGRSDLPWDEAVRLDLYYVENWSFTFDLILLWRTAFAVLRGAGAY